MSKSTRVSFYYSAVLLVLLLGQGAWAQTEGYRVTPLASDLPGFGQESPPLFDPWGIAFLPQQNFVIAEYASGRVDAYDANGTLRGGVTIPAPPGSSEGLSRPTGVAAIPEADFGVISGPGYQFLVAADNGTIWGFSVAGGIPQAVTRFVDMSSTAASYTGVAVVRPACCGAYAAVANFGQGFVDTFTRLGDPLSLSPFTANPFIDPNLPSGYAPFNVAVVGNEVFVTYALQDSAHAPVFAPGAGMVNVFDLVGNFLRRFASPGGVLSAPWGITRASANFGPFSNAILIGNAGDGRINAFDADGNALGALGDGNGGPFLLIGVRGLAFRADGFADADTLYQTSGTIAGEPAHGLFAAITTERATRTTLEAPSSADFGASVALTAHTTSLAGTPSGIVIFVEGNTSLGVVNLDANGTAVLNISSLALGQHTIRAGYSGQFDSSTSAPVTVTIVAPSTAPIITGFSPSFARQSSAGLLLTVSGSGFVNGAAVMFNGSPRNTTFLSPTQLTAALSAGDLASAGTATVRVVNPAPGGAVEVMFAVDTATATTASLEAPSITLTAGQSATVRVQTSGFTGPLSAACLNAPAGVSCRFDAAASTLTIQSAPTTARGSYALTAVFSAQAVAGIRRSGGVLAMWMSMPGMLLGGVFAGRRRRRLGLAAIAFLLALAMAGCGGSSSSNGGGNRTPQAAQASASLTVVVQ